MKNSDKPTIALVDDDDTFHYLLRFSIRQTGKAVNLLQFYNGRETLEYLRKHAGDVSQLPDVLFLDLNMPDMDGWSFLDEFDILKEPITKKKITIYIVTSSIDQNDIERANEKLSVRNFITKPIAFDQLNTILEGLKVPEGLKV